MPKTKSHLVVLSGPNGAGKSTIASKLLQGTLQVSEFVNADIIAQGISAFKPEEAAFQAGRVMLKRLHELAKQRINFAFETTLASRSFFPWIEKNCRNGYLFHLIFLWMPNPEFCIKRVKDRVSMGGHDVPHEVIRRRYHSGLRNFFSLYQPLANSWYFYNNSVNAKPLLIAEKAVNDKVKIHDEKTWKEIIEEYHATKKV